MCIRLVAGVLARGALLAALALPAAAHAAGVNLEWDACGAGATSNKVFACDTNAGADTLHCSFVAPAGITHLTAIELVVDLLIASNDIPDWWQLFNAGTCRRAAVAIDTNAPGGAEATCADPWNGLGSARLGAYWTTPAIRSGLSKARLVGVGFMPLGASAELETDREYHAFRVVLSHGSTTGAGACNGCNVPVCLALGLKLVQPVGVGDYYLGNPNRNNTVTWQGGSFAGGCTVATRNRTWGQIKSIWR